MHKVLVYSLLLLLGLGLSQALPLLDAEAWERATPAVGSQMWIGGMIELVGGVLMAVGLFTRAAAFIASGTMAVAYVQFHWKLAGGADFFPIVNKGEAALVYCFLFLYFACRGAGRASIDGVRDKP